MSTPWFRRLADGLSKSRERLGEQLNVLLQPRSRPRRGVLERPRGHAHRRGHRLHRDHRDRRRACATEPPRKALPDAAAVVDALAEQIAAEFPPTPRTCFDDLAGHRADGRRQRHRQDDHGRQARQAGRRLGPHGHARQRGHVPRRRSRAARRLGRARAGARSSAATAEPTLPPSRSTPSSTAEETGADLTLIDTAGRLHTSADLMRELQKVKRVTENRSKPPVKTRARHGRDDRAERSGAGARVRRGARCRRHHAHQARRHRQGRHRRRDRRASSQIPDPAHRRGGGHRRPAALRRRRLRPRAGLAVSDDLYIGPTLLAPGPERPAAGDRSPSSCSSRSALLFFAVIVLVFYVFFTRHGPGESMALDAADAADGDRVLITKGYDDPASRRHRRVRDARRRRNRDRDSSSVSSRFPATPSRSGEDIALVNGVRRARRAASIVDEPLRPHRTPIHSCPAGPGLRHGRQPAVSRRTAATSGPSRSAAIKGKRSSPSSRPITRMRTAALSDLTAPPHADYR